MEPKTNAQIDLYTVPRYSDEWGYATPQDYMKPCLYKGRLLYPHYDRIGVVDLTTGTLSHVRMNSIRSAIAILPDCMITTQFKRFTVHKISGETFSEPGCWAREIGSEDIPHNATAVIGAKILKRDLFILGTEKSHLLAYDTAGEKITQVLAVPAVSKTAACTALAVNDDVIYGGCSDGLLFRVEPVEHRSSLYNFKTSLITKVEGSVTTLAARDQRLFILFNHSLLIFDLKNETPIRTIKSSKWQLEAFTLMQDVFALSFSPSSLQSQGLVRLIDLQSYEKRSKATLTHVTTKDLQSLCTDGSTILAMPSLGNKVCTLTLSLKEKPESKELPATEKNAGWVDSSVRESTSEVAGWASDDFKGLVPSSTSTVSGEATNTVAASITTTNQASSSTLD